jgi:RNA polymerase sigma-70 factor (ECF subfamily)
MQRLVLPGMRDADRPIPASGALVPLGAGSRGTARRALPGARARARLGAELTRLRPRLMQLARRITRDEHAAGDVVQRGFLKVLLHLDRFEARASFSTWVWRIVANEALQWRREEGRRGRHLAAARDGALAIPEVPASPADLLDCRRAIDRLRRALARLPAGDQALLEHALASAGSVAELGGATGVSPRTLRTRLHRARRRLRRVLEAME